MYYQKKSKTKVGGKKEEVTGKIGTCGATGWSSGNSGRGNQLTNDSKTNEAPPQDEQNLTMKENQPWNRNVNNDAARKVVPNNIFPGELDPSCDTVAASSS